ncbi:acetyltransferase [Brevibacillus fluminis]|uniref:Acetyltransferase n=1 Tax=Brevibacillus fluminis TaxID=511487 RepID=A0A3M8CVK4_9BACL|nr:acyltransferase family protein [Brevibacillus fluminis]RNB79723.1 acetyltransferase [Brevibacillus fluminis]
MPKPLNGSGRYIAGLDGLRALAVLAVIAYHLNFSWASGGLLGVGVFFVLSGYLITDILATQWKKYGQLDLKDFWIRRARRLLPAMLLMLAVVVCWTIATDRSQLPTLRSDSFAAIFYVSNWWLIFHQVSYFESFGPPSPLGHLWSLAVEEQFYLLWPLLLALGFRYVPQRGKMALLTLGGAAISAIAMALLFEPGIDPSRIYYGTDTRSFALLIGAALALIWPSAKLSSEKTSPKARFTLDLVGGVSLLAVLLMIAFTNEYDEFLYRGGMVVLSVATALLVASLAHPASRIGKWLGCKPLRWLGVRSYGIYLWHYPVIVFTSPAVNTDGVDLTRAVLQLAASIILAALSWRFLEEPIRHGAIEKLWAQLRNREFAHGRVRVNLLITSTSALLVFSLFALVATASPAPHDSFTGTKHQGGTVTGGGSEGTDAANGAGSSGVIAGTTTTNPAPDTGKTGASSKKGSNSPDKATPPKTDAASGKDAHSADKGSTGKKTGTPNNATDKKGNTANTGSGKNSQPSGGSGDKKDSHPTNNSADKTKPGKGGSSTTPSDTNVAVKPQSGKGITAIGDSVMVDIQPYLEKILPGIVVDGKIGRQLSQAQEVVNQLKAEGKLGSRIIIELGTNGAFTKKQLESLLNSLGDVQQIVLVNTRVPRPWENVVNETLAEVAAAYPNATLVDWYSASTGKDSFFYNDGVHLRPDGSAFYAAFVAKAIAPATTKGAEEPTPVTQ